MREFLLRATSLVAAMVCGTVAGMLVVPFGLVVGAYVMLPLMFGIAALFAALGASWVGISSLVPMVPAAASCRSSACLKQRQASW